MQKITVMDVENNKETPLIKPLRYHETLDAFCDVIAEHYYECEIDVYRTAVCNPPTDFVSPQQGDGILEHKELNYRSSTLKRKLT